MSTAIEWLSLATGLGSLLLLIGSLVRGHGRSRARAVWAIGTIGLFRISLLSTTEVSERQQSWQVGCASVLLLLVVRAWRTDRADCRRADARGVAGE